MYGLWQKIKFPLISFVSGYVLMAVELTSTRLVAPFVGLSVYTWTSVIGIMLLGLSIGNYLGGFLADKTNAKKALNYSVLAGVLFIALIPTLTKIIPDLVFYSAPLIAKILLISLLLFLLPAIFLGSIYPLLIKLYSSAIETIGKKAGWLSATWSLGSILGTFLTGFFFIGFLGSTKALYLLALSLLISIFLVNDFSFKKNLFLIVLFSGILISFFIVAANQNITSASIKFDDESNYYKIRVVDNFNLLWGSYRILFLDFDSHSFVSLENRKLNKYTEIYPLFKVFFTSDESAYSGKDKTLRIYTIGGGAYTLAKGFAVEYPGSEIIVSEIDSKVTQTAINFFNLNEYPQIKTVFKDGRIYLANDSQKYDLIFGDAFNSFISLPWHVTTLEFNEIVKKHLTDGGIYAVNFVSALDGENSHFFKSMLKTFTQTFPNFYVFSYGRKFEPQNIVLVGLNLAQKIPEMELRRRILELKDGENFLRKYKPNLKVAESATILTDDFAPVEKLMMPLINNYFLSYANFYYSLLAK